MKIEEVEVLEEKLETTAHTGGIEAITDKALSALRAEAWHPIEKAEELGAKDGREVIGYRAINAHRKEFYSCRWYEGSGGWRDRAWPCDPTHFRFINPPEGE